MIPGFNRDGGEVNFFFGKTCIKEDLNQYNLEGVEGQE